jgi:hypothetical protein
MAPDDRNKPWVLEKFDPSWNEGGLLEVSSFSIPFRKDRGMPPPPLLLSSCDLLNISYNY